MTSQHQSAALASGNPFASLIVDVPEAVSSSREALAYVQSARCQATRRARLLDLKDAACRLGLDASVPLLELTSEQIARYRDLLISQGQAPATISRKICSLRGLFTYAIRRGWAGRNPADSVLLSLPLVVKQSLSEWLSKEEARRILEACNRTTDKGIRDYAIITVLLYHALRCEELVSLTPAMPSDWNARRAGGYFSTERHHIVLTIKGKGGRIRRHPVKPSTLEAVEDYLTATGRTLRSDGPLFRPIINNRTGTLEKALSPSGLSSILHQRILEADVSKHITPHSFRHSSATYALDAGATVRKVADFLGHSDIRTTMLYDRARENLEQNAALVITL